MPNTYTQIHIQAVFAVKYRAALILPTFKDRLSKYITGIVKKNGHKLLSINSMPDHLHMFFGFRPNQSLSDLMQFVKGDSSEWVNAEKFIPSVFIWQEGFGAFSYKKSDIPTICRYIENQEKHHQKLNFLDEYKSILDEFGIDYNEKYLFHSPL